VHEAAIADIDTERPERQARLAELVLHLTECSPHDALQAVGSTPADLGNDEALARVAAALVALRR
jgi:hypothetical protein